MAKEVEYTIECRPLGYEPQTPKVHVLADLSPNEKQEIAEAVAKMTKQEVAGMGNLIHSNCKEYRHKVEQEVCFDELPDEVQLQLLKYVRNIFGNPSQTPSPDTVPDSDETTFEPLMPVSSK